MPRGNLEGIHPRPLVLATLARLHRKKDSAFRLAASNRLDLNVLIDYRWPAAESDATALVEGVRTPAALSDLIMGMSDASVCVKGAVYEAIHAGEGPPCDETDPDKVVRMCRALRGAMMRTDPGGYIGPVMVTHLREGDIAGALSWVRRLREWEVGRGEVIPTTGFASGGAAVAADGDDDDEEETARAGAGSGSAGVGGVMSSEAAVRHLLILSGSRELYRGAVAMYDLPLAYFGEPILSRSGAAGKRRGVFFVGRERAAVSSLSCLVPRV